MNGLAEHLISPGGRGDRGLRGMQMDQKLDKPKAEYASVAAKAPRYQSGFGNEFATEALPGALPVGQNSPQKVPYGLYAEQFSGTAFTAPRAPLSDAHMQRVLEVEQGGMLEVLF